MNIIIKNLYPRPSSKTDATTDLAICMQNLSMLARAVSKENDRLLRRVDWVMEYGYPPGGGWALRIRLEKTVDSQVSGEFEVITGLKGPIKVSVAHMEIDLNLEVLITEETIDREAAKIIRWLA